MNIASEASKILTNKYFLYFIVFLAASNVLGYLVSNKVNAVIFFALVAFLVSNFSKNMSVILLISIIATNLLMVNKTMREGLENANMTDEEKASAKAKAEEKKSTVTLTDEQQSKKDSINTDTLADVDPQLGSGLNTLKTSDNTEDAKAKIHAKKLSSEHTGEMENISEDPNNRGMKRTTEPETFKAIASTKGKKGGFHNIKSGSSLSNAAPVNGGSRIDYATTLEDAYSSLDNILGSDGISKLTNDTQRLMTQQQKLFDTMNNMLPMVEGAKSMIDSLDMSKLGGMANMLQNTK
jgi:hypothetical protein